MFLIARGAEQGIWAIRQLLSSKFPSFGKNIGTSFSLCKMFFTGKNSFKCIKKFLYLFYHIKIKLVRSVDIGIGIRITLLYRTCNYVKKFTSLKQSQGTVHRDNETCHSRHGVVQN